MRVNLTRIRAYLDVHLEKISILFILLVRICVIIPIIVIMSICYVIFVIIWRIFLLISVYLLDKP